jgi:hypothetical protein
MKQPEPATGWWVLMKPARSVRSLGLLHKGPLRLM